MILYILWPIDYCMVNKLFLVLFDLSVLKLTKGNNYLVTGIFSQINRKTEPCLLQVVYMLIPTVNIHALKVLSSWVWWRKQSIHSPLWISEERKGKHNASLFPCSDISNSHMFVLKMIQIFFFPLSKHLLLKSSNPLYSLVLHSAALVLLCVDKSLWVHASLICPTGEDVDGLAGRCRCLLLSLDIPPPYSTWSSSVCCCTVVSPFQACL